MHSKKIDVVGVGLDIPVAYGTLVDAGKLKPNYSDASFSFTKNIATAHFSEDVGFSIVKSFPDNRVTPLLEYHRNTKEVLIPTNGSVILVLALGEGSPDANTVLAFELECGKAFIVDANVWHYAPISVEKKEIDTFVIFNKNTSELDVVKVDLLDAFGYVIEV